MRATLRAMGQYVLPKGDWRVRGRIALALLCLGVAKLATVVTPLIYGAAVDHISRGGFNLTILWALIGGYGLARLGQEIFGELKQIVFSRITQRAVRKAALDAFRHLHALSLRFHLGRRTGGLTRAIDRGAKGIDLILSLVMFEILPTLVEVIMVGGILWKRFGLRYALVTTGAIVAYVVFTIGLTEWRIKFRNRLNAADDSAATQAVDSLLNYETIKYFNAEEEEAKRYDRSLRSYEEAVVQWRTSLGLVNFGQGSIIALGLVAVMGMAGYDIRSGALSVGDFVVVNTYLLQLYLPLGFLGLVYREVRSSLLDMSHMLDLLDETPQVQDRTGAPDLVLSGGEVEFEDVSFSYEEQEVLSGISFRVPAKGKVALVGPSGAGKSTLVRLLFRFYDPDAGTIRIDGQDIRSVSQVSLRATIGVVPQDTVLFNDTIGRNIAYGRSDATQAEIEKAAHLAALDKFIDQLQDRYETVVGERGLKLSGGERQRVAIARVILKNPEILILDEATSSLDSGTEKEIMRALDQVSRSRTTLVIAHRLSTVVDADTILVLAEGRVIERGDHETLLAQEGMYAAMWRQQQASGEGADVPRLSGDRAKTVRRQRKALSGSLSPQRERARDRLRE